MINSAGLLSRRKLDLGTLLSLSLLAILALALFIFFRQETQKADYKKYLSAANEQHVLVQQIDKYAVESGSGIESSFVKLREARNRMAELSGVLVNGDESLSLPPSPAKIQPKLKEMEQAWEAVNAHVNSILSSQSVIVRADRIVSDITEQLPAMHEAAEAAAKSMAETGKGMQVYYATRQLYLVQQIETNLHRVLEGGPTTVLALDHLSQITDEMAELEQGPLNIVGKTRFSDETVANLQEVAKQLDSISRYRDELLSMVVELLPAVNALGRVEQEADGELRQNDATAVMSVAVDNMAAIDTELVEFYRDNAGVIELAGVRIAPLIVWGLFIVAALLLLAVVYLFVSQRSNASRVVNENERNQAAIRKLLREISGLGDGDLSIEATVSDDITGAIADSINMAVESMREVVTSINRTSVNVSEAAKKSQYLTSELTGAARSQVRDVSAASKTSQKMLEALEEMAEKAKDLSQVTVHNYELAAQGGRAVNQNVEAMGDLREQIQGTSKRIKRLGESSQEIGSIIGLINGITDQTNILAMNASMQAANAGEAGRGFSLVADELQRLAERSGRATKQIESLISAIQADTSEAVSSMESSITTVLNGARQAEHAGDVLAKIETVSRKVTDSSKEMSTSAEMQSLKATGVRETLQAVREVTEKMANNIKLTNQGAVFLARNVLELRKSVAEFTLPEQDQVEQDKHKV
ncbi:MAG: hypothetical protein CSA53_02835 [Gammaproteobacteria bacterium]|nr:MAG: hypothetical protein CSA53_02835 [Gammaproteobacteria bacterium]